MEKFRPKNLKIKNPVDFAFRFLPASPHLPSSAGGHHYHLAEAHAPTPDQFVLESGQLDTELLIAHEHGPHTVEALLALVTLLNSLIISHSQSNTQLRHGVRRSRAVSSRDIWMPTIHILRESASNSILLFHAGLHFAKLLLHARLCLLNFRLCLDHVLDPRGEHCYC